MTKSEDIYLPTHFILSVLGQLLFVLRVSWLAILEQRFQSFRNHLQHFCNKK